MIGAKIYFIADDKVRVGIVTAVTKDYKGKITYHAAYFGDDGEIYEKFIPEKEIFTTLDYLLCEIIEEVKSDDAKRLRELFFKEAKRAKEEGNVYEVWFYKEDKKIAEKTFKMRDKQSLMFEIFTCGIDADSYFIIPKRTDNEKKNG